MTTLSEAIKQEMVFTQKRMAEATEEISKIFALYRSLERHLLSETRKWQTAQVAEAQQARAVEAVSE